MEGFEDYNKIEFKSHTEKIEYLHRYKPTFFFSQKSEKPNEISKKDKEVQYSNICFTINNYSSDDIQNLDLFDCKFLIYSFEVGNEGTPHIQGFMQVKDLKNRPRYTFLQKNISTRIFVQQQRGSLIDQYKYIFGGFPVVQKNQEVKPKNISQLIFIRGKPRAERGTTGNNSHLILEDIDNGDDINLIMKKYPLEYIRYNKIIKEHIIMYQNKMIIEENKKVFENYNLLSWQCSVNDLLKEKVNRRAFFWIHEPYGNVGKSEYSTYLRFGTPLGCYNISPSSAQNMAYLLKTIGYNGSKPLVIDLPRTFDDDYICGIYNIIEQVLSGIIVSMKYESSEILAHVPHVLIFSNKYPPIVNPKTNSEYISLDRFRIYKINEQNELVKDELVYPLHHTSVHVYPKTERKPYKW